MDRNENSDNQYEDLVVVGALALALLLPGIALAESAMTSRDPVQEAIEKKGYEHDLKRAPKSAAAQDVDLERSVRGMRAISLAQQEELADLALLEEDQAKATAAEVRTVMESFLEQVRREDGHFSFYDEAEEKTRSLELLKVLPEVRALPDTLARRVLERADLSPNKSLDKVLEDGKPEFLYVARSKFRQLDEKQHVTIDTWMIQTADGPEPVLHIVQSVAETPQVEYEEDEAEPLTQ